MIARNHLVGTLREHFTDFILEMEGSQLLKLLRIIVLLKHLVSLYYGGHTNEVIFQI